MSKTPILTDATGTIVPGVGNNLVTVPDFDTPTGIECEFSRDGDFLMLVAKNIADDGYVPETDEKGIIELSRRRRKVVIDYPGDYALQGNINGTVTAAKEVV